MSNLYVLVIIDVNNCMYVFVLMMCLQVYGSCSCVTALGLPLASVLCFPFQP